MSPVRPNDVASGRTSDHSEARETTHGCTSGYRTTSGLRSPGARHDGTRDRRRGGGPRPLPRPPRGSAGGGAPPAPTAPPTLLSASTSTAPAEQGLLRVAHLSPST